MYPIQKYECENRLYVYKLINKLKCEFAMRTGELAMKINRSADRLYPAGSQLTLVIDRNSIREVA